MRYRIVIEWSAEDGAYVARVPALGPGIAADGPTPADAAREITQVAEAVIEDMRADGEPLPPEDSRAGYSGKINLRMPRSLHEELDRLATAEGVSLNQEMLTLLARGAGLKKAKPARSTRPTEKRRRAAAR